MKKRFITVLLLVCMTMACFSGCGGSKEKLYIFLPGEYLGEDLISNFEDQYNCRVVIENFESNEMMYAKLGGGNKYDILIPSDYMIERLLKEGALQPIDKSVVTNLDLLYDGVKNLAFDPDNSYSAPYLWGTIGILYDKTKVSLEDLEREGYDIFKDTRYKGQVVVYDSERDGFMMALKQLGYSANTTNTDEIEEAFEWLMDLSKTMEPELMTDEVINEMMNGNYAIANVYNGDAITIGLENPNMEYFLPLCGTNVWVDAMVIPKDAMNPELANKFINYVLTYEPSMDNCLTVGYSSPNAQVLEELSSEGGEYYGVSAFVPRTYEKDEIYHDNEIMRTLTADYWIRFTADN